MYDAVIFDLDGTLICTSTEGICTICGSAFNDIGAPQSREDIKRFWFGSDRDRVLLELGVGPGEYWKAFEKYDTVETRKQFVKPYNDTGFIDEIRERGLKTGIVTGAPPHIAYFETGLIGDDKFDAVVVAHPFGDVKEQKPHPKGVIKCLDTLGVEKERAMFVGNGEEDILAARNAGVMDVLLTRGENNLPEIRPSITIKTLYELERYL